MPAWPASAPIGTLASVPWQHLCVCVCVCVRERDQEEQGPLSAQLSLLQGSARLHSAYVGFHRSSHSPPLTNSRTPLPVLSATNLVPNSLQRSLSGNFPEDPIHPRALAPDDCRSDKGSDKHTPPPRNPLPTYKPRVMLPRSNTQLFGCVCMSETRNYLGAQSLPHSRINSHPLSKTRAI